VSEIKSVCVIGAGVMGAGIAAQIANSCTHVVLLDIVPCNASDRNIVASSAKAKMTLGKPQLAHPSLLKYIAVGNLEDDLEVIRTCDWIIEVIVEKPDIKAALYDKIAPFIPDRAILSSNTSTLPMKKLRNFLSLEFQSRFFLTHFFNPPRQMKLLELVYDEQTSKSDVTRVASFIENKLGKTIVKSHDTPGFIANRIGCFLMQLCLKEAYDKKLSISFIDRVFAKYLGFPSTGIFGLFDLIGLDVMRMISEVLVDSLDKKDKFCTIYQKYDFYTKMLDDGYKGRKGLGGFYKLKEINGVKTKEVLNFATMNYEPLDSDELILDDSIKAIMKIFFEYVHSLLGVVSDSKEDIDTAMKLGYSWAMGPFEMEEFLNGKTSAKKSLVLSNTILENSSSYMYEAQKGNLVFGFKTKLNVLNEEVFELLIESINYAEKHKVQKLIIYTPGKHFSAGADLKRFLEIATKKDFTSAERFLELGQRAMMRIKYAKIPVISCAQGVALGGGCELLLHSHAVVAHLDLCAGLVEVGVGLIPGWGGVKEMILRAKGDKDNVISNLKNIIMRNQSSSAYGFFTDYTITNGICIMNENHLLEYALSNDFSRENADKKTYDSGDIDLISPCMDLKLDNHTYFIAKELQEELNSSSLSEEEVLSAERRIFQKLLFLPETIDKMSSVGAK
jgi:3-hydroxyacyl-CoA dehydrogenase / enoyl-CoA hydratase / 3-hydroxybutyryl-CoA epimerase